MTEFEKYLLKNKIRFMTWYNCVRPHGAFDISKLETPVQIFHRKMEDRDELIDPDALTREEIIS